jgi:hypothetical protein
MSGVSRAFIESTRAAARADVQRCLDALTKAIECSTSAYSPDAQEQIAKHWNYLGRALATARMALERLDNAEQLARERDEEEDDHAA